MPRPPRVFPPETALHIINRGNDRRALFSGDGEYAKFLVLIRRAARHHPVRILAYVLMPNHWHLVVVPGQTEHVSRFLQRLTGAHAARLRRATRTVGEGHVYQGRYHALVLESALRLLRTMRYVEANPVRAGLVERARGLALVEPLRAPGHATPHLPDASGASPAVRLGAYGQYAFTQDVAVTGRHAAQEMCQRGQTPPALCVI